MPACQKYAKLLKAHDRTSGRIDKLLLDLSVFAAYTRFLSRKEYKTYPSYPQEKSIQCVIAKYSMLNSVWKENADSLVVIDVETHLFKQGGRHPRADFAVFDGNAFGLVEFKYLGQSIDSKNNNLAKHYEDFATAMEPQNGEKLFKLLKMKLKYLMGYGLIDESWQKKVMEICDREYDRSALWCGFYFLGDAADIPGKKKNIVVDRIERQIKPIRKKMPVRGQISKIDPDHLDEIRMNIKEIREIKEDADDAEA